MKNSKIKHRFVPYIPEELLQKQDVFDDLLCKTFLQPIKAGTVVSGTVIAIDRDEAIVVEVPGMKSESRIPVSEFYLQKNSALPKVGDQIKVYIEKTEGRYGRTVLSYEKSLREESWTLLEAAHAADELVNGIISGPVNGGFIVEVSAQNSDLPGVIAFLPGSHLDVRPVKDIKPLLGVLQPLKILKMDKKLGNIVVSRREVLQEHISEAREAMLAKIEVGMVLKGVVKNITDYGAFIDLDIMDGLLHVTDISWNKINHPSEKLSLGQEVSVKVIKFNPETQRISLGMKQLEPNPWENIDQVFPIGEVRTGKITNIADYGVFVSLNDEIEGLVHTTEISWVRANQNPRKNLTLGQEVTFKILEIDKEKHRMSLSIKQCYPNPWKQFAEKYSVGDTIEAPIRNITDFGMFIVLDGDIDGMIHESDISWEGNGTELLKDYNKGDVVSCKILSIDIDKERISLGIKQTSNSAQNDKTNDQQDTAVQKGSLLEVRITDVLEEGVEVSLPNGSTGFIKQSDLSSVKADQKASRFNVGDNITAKVTSIDKSGKISLSIKAAENDSLNQSVLDYANSSDNSSATNNLGDVLDGTLSQNQKKDS